MGQLKLLGGVLALASPAFAAFNVYALHDREAVKTSLGVSSECLSALNYTVECDGPNAVRATKNSESDLTWSMENLTTLCTDGCSKSLSTWLETVEQNCDGEEVTVNGLIIDPKAFPLKYISGYDLACLQDSNDNWCFYEAQSWDSSVYTSWDKKLDACNGDNLPTDCDKKGPESDADTLFVTNAYNKELYCSECFMLLWRQRIESPVFPQGNLMNHFTEQFNKLEAACSTKLPLTTPAPAVALRAKDSAYSLATSTVFRNAQPPAVTTTRVAIARRGSLQTFYTPATPDRTTQLGAIEACGKYYNVVPGDTCDAISAEFGVTMDELMEYNPKLHPKCENLWANFAICVAPISPRPMAVDGNCGENNAYATCNGSPFGSCVRSPYQEVYTLTFTKQYTQCNDQGRCEPCGPEATSPPSPQTVPDEKPPTEEPPKEKSPSEEPSKEDTKDDEHKKESHTHTKDKLPLPSGGGNSTMISKDGSCNEHITCVGSPFGNCCSTSGWCGYGPAWCGIGNCVSGDCDTKDGASGKPPSAPSKTLAPTTAPTKH